MISSTSTQHSDRLQILLPEHLVATLSLEPSLPVLTQIFEHLRTLQYILNDYMPRSVVDGGGSVSRDAHYSWQSGTLLFTDLAGFTPLLEANAAYGQQGASLLLKVLNQYFAEMLEIISKSGGDLLEFTGDAMLVQFLATPSSQSPSLSGQEDLARAIRAGLRMQRAMRHFTDIHVAEQQFSLGMRVGIHSGQFLTAEIGNLSRKAHVLLGRTVQYAKQVEGEGQVGRVCIKQQECDRLPQIFAYEPTHSNYGLVKDDLANEQLGEYDITLNRRRQNPLLFGRSITELQSEIEATAHRTYALASYLPLPILRLLVEHAAQRHIPPRFTQCAVLFINLQGFTESVDGASVDEVAQVVSSFSTVFDQINQAVSSQNGILQKVTYQLVGSDILAYFGLLDNPQFCMIQAVEAALQIRQCIHQQQQQALPLLQQLPQVECRFGLTYGSVFAAEIGEPRGRREFNILGDPVNIAARLMTRAANNELLTTETIYQQIASTYSCQFVENALMKGKTQAIPIYSIGDRI